HNLLFAPFNLRQESTNVSITRNLRDDALSIWRAAVAAVDSEKLVRNQFTVDGDRLIHAGEPYQLPAPAKIVVVGAGKAGAGMASGVELALAGTDFEPRLSGWVNVPADCLRPLKHVYLHAARPAGVNEP